MVTVNAADISHVYQPMWSLEGWGIFGYEALMRINNRANLEIEKVFSEARLKGCLYEIDSLSVESAIHHISSKLLDREYLFINIFPSTILDKRFENFISHLKNKYSFIPEKIVFELNETIEEDQIWNFSEFRENIDILRGKGYKIALDDVGKGAATIQKIIEHSPDYIKLDRYFSENLSTSKEKQEMISLLINYSKQKMCLILEGIEQEADLAYARMIKVPVAQGYLLGRPQTMEEHLRSAKKAMNL